MYDELEIDGDEAIIMKGDLIFDVDSRKIKAGIYKIEGRFIQTPNGPRKVFARHFKEERVEVSTHNVQLFKNCGFSL